MLRASMVSEGDDWLIALQNAHRTVPEAVEQYAKRELRPFVSQQVDKTLRREPPPAIHPIQWTSDKQQCYVMAKLRKEGNLPYARAHKFVKGWHVIGDYHNGLTSIVVFHDSDLEQYITGRNKQQFHDNTGWPSSGDVLQLIILDLEERVEAGLPIVIDQALRGISR